MSYGRVEMKISILFLVTAVFLGTNGDVYYVPKITDNVLSCDNYENDFLDCDDLKLGSTQGEDGEEAAKLGGLIKLSSEIVSDYDVEVDIWKLLDLGDEYMYNTRINFCASLQNEDAPWAPIMEKLNISSCPVPVEVFEVQGLTISLDSMKDVMCHEFIGQYRVQLAFMDVTEKISCHIIELRIAEINDDDEEDC